MSVNANESDVLIFCGSGTTGAVNKLVSALKLKSGGGKNTVGTIEPKLINRMYSSYISMTSVYSTIQVDQGLVRAGAN